MDAGLLYMETATVFTHTVKIVVFDRELETEPYSFEKTCAEIEQCTRMLTHFRKRLLTLPLAYHHPLWIDDPDFAIENHVHEVSAPAPGGQVQLDEVVSKIAGCPLDRGRPLWEIWLVDGLEDESMAAIVKIHHALADGMAAARLFATVLGTSPDYRIRELAAPEPEARPSRLTLLRSASADHVRRALALPSLLARTARGLRAAQRNRDSDEAPVPRPLLDTPRTLLNTSLTSRRTFVSADLDLEAIKKVKAHYHVKVNDVLLAVVAGAVRRYLVTRDALPDRPLVVEVPVSTDPSAQPDRTHGNRTSNLFAFLRTDIEDPAERLLAIHAATEASKRMHARVGADMYQDWSEYAPPGLYMGWMRLFSRYRFGDLLRPAINLIVSSVPGPRTPLYFDGARLRAIYSVGPILEGVGLNITMWSYLDRVSVGALACPDHIENLREITEAMPLELAALA
jgi:WS/DGAT/MGAT family acyltransferase